MANNLWVEDDLWAEDVCHEMGTSYPHYNEDSVEGPLSRRIGFGANIEEVSDASL